LYRRYATGFEKQVGKRSHFRFYNGPSVEPKQAGELTVAQLRDPAVGACTRY
jgi:hypothetical protein